MIQSLCETHTPASDVRALEKNGLSDGALAKAVAEMEQGLIDADLGGYVFKKRVAFPGL
ncbi:hypothetical protein LFE_0356 [Leptospirillum ferrooxidans C2-3]|uniref:Uncharacterized protein n=1 Tax=Leptospirillum ferrooxidans (strain C2-3) TaxID=1162668 RepID=I0ILC9_LEPFC|nr:hypothetical protein LFE_0356 [Leptospirillum ferrooxidans C2-3]